jgi:hypothetical protein
VVWNDITQHPEPESGQLRQNLTFVRYRVWQNAVKRRQPVRRDQQQTLFIYLIDVTYFAAVQQPQALDLGF